jgi:hypothetical protein
VGSIAFSEPGHALDVDNARERLRQFVAIVENEERRATFPSALSYFAASRAASNDAGPRQTRINVMTEILLGELPMPQA